MTQRPEHFVAPAGLGNPHLQTTFASILRKARLRRSLQPFLHGGDTQIIDANGVKFKVHLHTHRESAQPTVVIIPGWLGNSESGYALGSAATLFERGFNVARINLRDHGNTADLNQELFNSARLDEVVDLIDLLKQRQSHPGFGILGFSLGGNFALRIAKQRNDIRTLAICPAIQPQPTMHRIDGHLIYQRYFLRKWRKTWAQKQAAFPGAYDFGNALQLSTVSALTDYFVRHHSDFDSTESYFRAYDLSGDFLNGVAAQILTTADDPIIEVQQFQGLPNSIQVQIAPQGGHTALLKNWGMQSWVDEYAADYFAEHLTVTGGD